MCMGEAGWHLDLDKAKNQFLGNFESISRLPLITDAEMVQLFGEEVNLALSKLESYNQQEKFCVNCESRCCLLVNCELYSTDFSRCPIHSFRPVICRMHFCNRFAPVYNSLINELCDIFLESLIAAQQVDKKKADVFDSPPLAKFAPGLVSVMIPHMTAFNQGRLDRASAIELIGAEALKYYGKSQKMIKEIRYKI